MEKAELFSEKLENIPREGDLYKRIEHDGRVFRIVYGYYEQCDRANPLVLPVPIYPDFISQPEYDSLGYPYVTDMQDTCSFYTGTSAVDGCYGCAFYLRIDGYLGLCRCEQNRVKR